MSQGIFHLAELAAAAGVTARTVRYYVSRKLLPGPTVMGREAHYTQVHLDILKRIVKAQDEGKTLNEVASIFSSGSADIPSSVTDPVNAFEYNLAEDVTVYIKESVVPSRKRVVHSALTEFAKAVRVTEKEAK